MLKRKFRNFTQVQRKTHAMYKENIDETNTHAHTVEIPTFVE